MAVRKPPTPPQSLEPPASERLESWKEISAYLKRDERTARRWEKEGLPVYRLAHAKKATVYSYKSAIDAWWRDGRTDLELREAAASRHRRVLSWWAVAGLILVSAGSMAIDVAGIRSRFLARPAADNISSIAVLPLVNLSRDVEQDNFADGITEALTTELARVSALRVISRESSMQFKGSKTPVAQIGEALKVDAVVQGSVVRDAGRVSVTAQLVQVRPERQLWAERFERDVASVLTLQSDVAQAIAHEIHATLTPRPHALVDGAGRVNPLAYDAYAKGIYFTEKVTPDGIAKGIEYFTKAIDIEPTYAPAYAGLADVYNRAAIQNFRPAKEVYPAAKLAVSKALQFDDTLAEALIISGVIKFRFDWDWVGAERDLKAGLEFNPNSSRAHLGYSTYLLAMKRIDEAVRMAQRNVELDPLTVQRHTDLAWKLSYAGRPDEAITHLKEALEIAPDSANAYGQLGGNYAAKHMFADALAMCDRALNLQTSSFGTSDCGRVYVEAGRQREAVKVLQHLLSQSSVQQYGVARLYDALGDHEQAVHWMVQAYEARAPEMCFLQIDTLSASLRADPRFQDILRRMKFPS